MAADIAPAEPTEPAAVAPRERTGRRWPIVVAVVAGLLVLAVALVATEAIARDYARAYLRDGFVAALGLPDDTRVDVELGPGSILLQALSGRVDEVDVEAPEAAFAGLSGAVRLHAEGVPLDEAAPVEVLRVDVAIGADDLAAVGQDAGIADAADVEIAGGEVRRSSEFALFGTTIPLVLSLEPSAVDGALVLTPTTVTVGDQTYGAGSGDDSLVGQIVAQLFRPQTVCVASSVPRAFVLADASVDGPDLVLAFQADGASLGGSELSTPGSCLPG